jgi:hypothetical protein
MNADDRLRLFREAMNHRVSSDEIFRMFLESIPQRLGSDMESNGLTELDREYLAKNHISVGDHRDTLPVHPDAKDHEHRVGEICYRCEKLFQAERNFKKRGE